MYEDASKYFTHEHYARSEVAYGIGSLVTGMDAMTGGVGGMWNYVKDEHYGLNVRKRYLHILQIYGLN